MSKIKYKIISYILVFIITFTSANYYYTCAHSLHVYAESTNLQRMRDMAVTALSGLGYVLTGNSRGAIDSIVTLFRNGNLIAEYNDKGLTEDGGGYCKISINDGKWSIDEPIVKAVKTYMDAEADKSKIYTYSCPTSFTASQFSNTSQYQKALAFYNEKGVVELDTYYKCLFDISSKAYCFLNASGYGEGYFTPYYIPTMSPITKSGISYESGSKVSFNVGDYSCMSKNNIYSKSGQITVFSDKGVYLDYVSGTSKIYKGKTSYTSGNLVTTPVTEEQYTALSSAISNSISNLIASGDLPSVDDITRIINESLSALLQEQVAELQGVNVNLKETNSWLAKIYSLLGISNTTGATISSKLDSIITAINNASSNIVKAIGNNTGSSVTVDTASIVSMLQQIKNDIATNNNEVNSNILKIYKQCSDILTELQSTKDETITLDTAKLEKLLEEILANSKENTTGNVTINTDAIEGLLKDIKGVDTDIYNKLVDVDEGVLTDLLNSIQDYQSAAKGYFRDSLESSENIEKSLDRIEKLLLANTLLELGDNEEENKSLVDKMLAPVVAECTKTATTLKTKLPFSLPWDIYSLVMIMVSEPVAPKFEIPIHFESINYDDKVVIDLSKAEILSKLCRSMLSLIFAMYLIQLTRKFLNNKGD